METEFNLSEKIRLMKVFRKKPSERIYQDSILKKDVKKFIRLLEEECTNHNQKLEINEDYEENRINNTLLFPIIDKLAGEKLI